MQATNEKTTAFNAKFVKLEQMTVQQTEKMKKILQASDGAITSCEKIAGEYESELKTSMPRSMRPTTARRLRNFMPVPTSG